MLSTFVLFVVAAFAAAAAMALGFPGTATFAAAMLLAAAAVAATSVADRVVDRRRRHCE